MDPITIAALLMGGKELVGGLSDLIGSEGAGRAQRRAINRATGLHQPIYDTSLGAYTDLAGGYREGRFADPEFAFDPQSIFQDPEYAAQLRAGRDALEGGAISKGLLFSGTTARDLEKYGSDLFASRSDELFDRAVREHQLGAEGRARSFQQGLSLSAPLEGQASRLSDLALGKGDVNAALAQNRATGLGNIGSNLLSIGSDLALGTGRSRRKSTTTYL